MGSSSQIDLEEIYSFARDVASGAGQLLLDALEKRIDGSSAAVEFSAEKENSVDIVTKTDQGEYYPLPSQSLYSPTQTWRTMSIRE